MFRNKKKTITFFITSLLLPSFPPLCVGFRASFFTRFSRLFLFPVERRPYCRRRIFPEGFAFSRRDLVPRVRVRFRLPTVQGLRSRYASPASVHCTIVATTATAAAAFSAVITAAAVDVFVTVYPVAHVTAVAVRCTRAAVVAADVPPSPVLPSSPPPPPPYVRRMPNVMFIRHLLRGTSFVSPAKRLPPLTDQVPRTPGKIISRQNPKKWLLGFSDCPRPVPSVIGR